MGRADPIERVLNLLTLFHESSTPLTRAEVAAKLATGSTPYPTDAEAQRQAFTSDRRTIAAGLGIAVHQRTRPGDDAGRTEYWIDRADLLLPDLQLDDEERLVLAVALGAVSRRLPGAGEALLKLGGEHGSEPTIEFNVEVPDDVLAMMDAARQATAVRLTVAGGSFEFEPWVVVLDNGTWAVVGHDAAVGAPRAVRLDRLTQPAERLDRPRQAARPTIDDALLESVLDSRRADPMVATVLVDELTAARAALSAGVHEVGSPDLFGTVQMSIDVGDRARFRSWLLALGDRAEVVAPVELRNDVIGWLQAIVDTPPAEAPVPARPTTPATRRPGPEPVDARLRRLVSIVPWLYKRGTARIDDIAARVGVSPDQVVRDLTIASMCGIPPYTSDVLYGFWVDPEAGEVNVAVPNLLTHDVRLTNRQAVAVGIALSALEALPGGRTEVTARLRKKLAAATGEVPVAVELDEPLLLDDVRDAVDRHERVRVEYVDLEDRLTTRDLDPLKLFVDRGTSYVIADDHLRGAERVFRVDRMLSVRALGVHFEPRHVEIPAGRTWTWMVPADEVVVRLPPGSDWVLDRYATVAHAFGDDGWLTVWLSVVSERWLAALLLRCGPGATVLQPERLRDLATRQAAATLARYR